MNLMAQYDVAEAGPREQKTFLIGAIVPLGQGEFKVSYAKAEQEGVLGATNFNGADADQIAVGYVYNLSKRTAMYGHYGEHQEQECGRGLRSRGGSGSAPGDDLEGLRTGVRHSF